MYFAYVDESGDPGIYNAAQLKQSGGTRHYCLCGVLIPSESWTDYLAGAVEVRRELRRRFGFPVRRELHASELIHPRSNRTILSLGGRSRRVDLYRFALRSFTEVMPRAQLISVNVDKLRFESLSAQQTDFEELAWRALLVRFQKVLVEEGETQGLIFADETNEVKVRSQLRRMRRQSITPALFQDEVQETRLQILEDPVMRNSTQSYFVQFADLAAHALYRHRYPSGGLKRYNVDRLFEELAPLSGRGADGIIDVHP